MSALNSHFQGSYRKRILASAAVVALIATGAVGGSVMSASAPAHAAAIATGDLPTPSTPTFADVVSRVQPAVVSVKVDIDDAAVQPDQISGDKDNLPPQLRQFFKQFGESDGADQRQTHHMIGEGSGFFISADGYVVTNNHVVEHAKTVTITTNEGKLLTAKVIGTDPKTDLALLKVNEQGDYPFVSFAKSEPRVGDWVVAIGNPFGLGGTVTAGIVSAEGRDIGSGPYDQFIQIDAPINKGNSGGPTFNLKGEVVGVNTAIYSPSGGSVGVGFAIPSTTVDSVVSSLEHGGFVSRGYLGVMVQPVSQDIADGLGLKTVNGALVDQAEPGTPAANAGLKSGDVITKVNGQAVKDAADLTRHVGALKPGDKAEFSFLRDGVEKTASVTLGSQESERTAKGGDAQTDSSFKLGLQLAPAAQMAGAGEQGVAIVRVDPDGVGATKGLAEGDVILTVSGKAVSQPGEVKSEIAAAKKQGKKAVLMTVKTAQGERFFAFEFPKA